MNFRRVVSLTLLISLVPLLLTSVVLYIVPEGRVAYWSNWQMLGLSKTQWGDVHINLGWLFLAAGILHLYLNWKPILNYMRSKAKEFKLFTLEFNVGLVLTLFCFIGTLMGIPPLSTILDFGTSFKEAAAEKYGEPPYGHAELSSLKTLATRMGLEPQKVKEELERAGVKFNDPSQSVLDVSEMNNMTPKDVWTIMQKAKPALNEGEKEPFPDAPFPGFGRMKFIDICNTYGLDKERVIEAFAAKDMVVDLEKSIKDVAEEHGSDPHALFEILREAVQ